MNIIIPDQNNFEKLRRDISSDGLDNLHILSDFDRTLTYGSIDGVKTPSIISLLRDGKHLSKDYAEKANALFDKYSPMEKDKNIPLGQRKAAMQEWWETHDKLLVESGLSFSDLKDIVENGHLRFREGALEFFDFLQKHNIPLVILSASGCGDAIQLFFKKFGRDYQNVFYVTNKFNWNKDGKALSIKKPIIHSLNKDETIILDIPEVRNTVENRKNVILLGDGIGDLEMIKGFDYKNLLKIGFLNFDYKKLINEYKENFDVILEGDGDFRFVNDLVSSL